MTWRSPPRFHESRALQDMDRLIDAFEDLYEKVYAGVAKHPQAGYQIMELGVVASIPKVKPKLVQRPPGRKSLASEAHKGKREVYMDGKWREAPDYRHGFDHAGQ